jgi:hypothetical protein
MRQALKLHPDSVCAAVTRIEAEAARAGGGLALSFAMSGTIGGVVLPPPAQAARTDELWRHTCFEAFVRVPPAHAYSEFNFAPSTQWAAYRFDAYRAWVANANDVAPPRIEVQATAERYVMRVSLDALPLPRDATWRLGLSAVIEETDGRISYWALAHPPGKADFHHADCFACELPPSERS